MSAEAGGGRSAREPRDIIRELAEEDLRAVDGLGFPVYGPTEPRSDASALGWQRVNGQVAEVVLSHGSWLAVEGPFVSVQTMTSAAAEQGGAYSLQEIVEDERDRIFARTGIDEGEGPDLVVESELWIAVDGAPVRAVLRAEGLLWAARLDLGGAAPAPAPSAGPVPVTVTLTGRGIAPGRVGLRRVEQLEPYARGRQRQLALLREARVDQPHVRERELAPVRGLEAHRELVQRSVRNALRLEADLRSGRRPRSPRGEPRDDAELWERAVRQQMRLAGEDHPTANQSVIALVNQGIGLAEQTDWFPATPAGEAALEECIRYTVFDSEVPSIEAQRAWQDDWSSRIRQGSLISERGAVAGEWSHRHLDARSDWLELWQQWHRNFIRRARERN